MHDVSFDEVRSVFFNEFAIQFYDIDHSHKEERFIMRGISIESRVLVVSHCERKAGDIIRIISARKATKSERQYYSGAKR